MAEPSRVDTSRSSKVAEPPGERDVTALSGKTRCVKQPDPNPDTRA